MNKTFIIFAFVFLTPSCAESTEAQKCEIITDEMCNIINECSYIAYQECDDYFDENFCSEVEVGDNWEECQRQLYTMTCADKYPPDSCNDVLHPSNSDAGISE